MNNKMIVVSVVITIISLVGCKSDQNKFVQTEFDKMQGIWTINAFSTSINLTDSLKNTLKNGKMLFNKCVYDKKSFDKNAGCNGDFQINELFYDLSYSYNSTSKIYPLRLGPVDPLRKPVIITPGTEQYKVLQLMNGDWEFVATDNTLTAKQVKNTFSPNIQVSFTATRK